MENESQIERIIRENPHQFKDELDKWLFREFGVYGGACSSIESMRYSLAREVAQKAMEYAKQGMEADYVILSPVEYQETIERYFKDGMDIQKQEMMKDAIPAMVLVNQFGNKYIESWSGLVEYNKFKINEEVKLIIIKDEET